MIAAEATLKIVFTIYVLYGFAYLFLFSASHIFAICLFSAFIALMGLLFKKHSLVFAVLSMHVIIVGCAYLAGGYTSPILFWFSPGLIATTYLGLNPTRQLIFVFSTLFFALIFYSIAPQKSEVPIDYISHVHLLALLGIILSSYIFSREFVKTTSKNREILEKQLIDREIIADLKNKALLDQNIALAQRNALATAIADTAQFIAHDVQAPFSAIRLVLKTLQRTAGSDTDRFANLVSLIDKNAQYVQDLLQDLVRQNQLTVAIKEDCLLNNVVEPILDRFRILYPEKVIESNIDSILVQIDKQQINRLFSNLVSNAIDAMAPTANRIWIRTKQGPQMLEVVVGNEGSFVPEDQAKTIFYKYHTKGKKEGAGLGLAICAQIVSNHGGTIFCRSEVSFGTEFIFTLPYA